MQIPEYFSSQEEKGTGKAPFDPEHNFTAIYTGKCKSPPPPPTKQTKFCFKQQLK